VTEHAINLHGPTASLDFRAGPVTARVEVLGGADDLAVDFERDRLFSDSIPGPERFKWTSGSGALLLARLGWWGFRVIEDRLPRPDILAPATVLERRDEKRPRLPRDLASCPTCRALVVIRRAREGPGFRPVTPTTRLARRASEVMRADGLFAFVATCRGKGRKAGRSHLLDCYDLPLFRPFPTPPKRGRGRPRRLEPVKSPFPYDQAKKANDARSGGRR
jgi:hypothetical protein